MQAHVSEFLKANNIHEVECVISDMTGIARGKILPRDQFVGTRTSDAVGLRRSL
jgi:glutamine synthetase